MKISNYLMLGFFLFISVLAKAQLIDNYGFRIGLGQSNQYWNFEGMESRSEWKEDKAGFMGQVLIEKSINEFISFRPAIGYINKGCTETIEWIVNDPIDNAIPETSNYKLDLHYLSLDLVTKMSLKHNKFDPYILIGFRGNYLIDYKDEYEAIGLGFTNNYKTITLDGVLGVGLSYKNTLYLDFEFNPALTKNYDSSFISIKNRFYSFSIGLNLNKLL